MASTTSEISANVLLSDIGPVECISEKQMAEIVRRLQGVITFADPNVIARSQSQPTDTTKLWFQTNSQGLVTNIKFYNTNTGKWEDVISTAPETNRVCLTADNNALLQAADGCLQMPANLLLVNSTNSDNLIDLDPSGHIIVDSSTVRDMATTLDTSNLCNILRKNTTTNAISVDRGANYSLDVGIQTGIINGHLVAERVVTPAPGTIDLSLIPGVVWDEACPPTHVKVVACLSLDTGISVAGTWATPNCQIRAGLNLNRVACFVDGHDNEGTMINERTVLLDPADPKTFAYHLQEGASGFNWTLTNNYIGLFVSAFIWTSPKPT